jgi:carbohydrate kinase (thermoresistant glucokinase family)
MGVSGSGKSTVASALAKRLTFQFIEGDALHSAASVEKMSLGQALTDEDRRPWLEDVARQLAAALAAGPGCVIACSALRRSYRDTLRLYAPDTFFVMLSGSMALIRSRLEARPHAFMPVSLLASQFATLEPLEDDERGMTVEVTSSPDEIVAQITTELHHLERQ